MVFVAGQVGWNARGEFETDDLVAQVRQALANVRVVLAEAGARPEHITRMTWYLIDKREYLARSREIGAVFRELVGQLPGGHERRRGERVDRRGRKSRDRGHSRRAAVNDERR